MALYSLHLSVFPLLLRVRQVYDLGLVNNEFARLSNKIERFRSRIMLYLFHYRTHKEFRVRSYSVYPLHQSNSMERFILNCCSDCSIVRYVGPLVRRIQVIEKSIISQVVRQTLAGFRIPRAEFQISMLRIPAVFQQLKFPGFD